MTGFYQPPPGYTPGGQDSGAGINNTAPTGGGGFSGGTDGTPTNIPPGVGGSGPTVGGPTLNSSNPQLSGPSMYVLGPGRSIPVEQFNAMNPDQRAAASQSGSTTGQQSTPYSGVGPPPPHGGSIGGIGGGYDFGQMMPALMNMMRTYGAGYGGGYGGGGYGNWGGGMGQNSYGGYGGSFGGAPWGGIGGYGYGGKMMSGIGGYGQGYGTMPQPQQSPGNYQYRSLPSGGILRGTFAV